MVVPSSADRAATALSIVQKDTIILLKDLIGAQLCSGYELLIRSLMVRRCVGWKVDGSCRLVMISVFDGAEGVTSGGRVERSRVREGELARRLIGEVLPDVSGDGDMMCLV